LAETEKARTLLERAVELGDAKEIKLMARGDPEFAGLWACRECP
jgi:hypothetical protein